MPRLVFFFDEAHLLFDGAPKYLVEKIESVVRLIRSKGVGIFFVTQSPADVPSEVLGQLGNKIQHGLRAASEKDRKIIRSVAQNYPLNDKIDIAKEITALGIGESLVSVLTEKGIPSITEKILNIPPQSKMGPASDEVRKNLISSSPFAALYQQNIDRESAYEVLMKRRKEAENKAPEEEVEKKKVVKKSTRQGPMEAFFKSVLRSVGSQLGRQIIRGILGSIRK